MAMLNRFGWTICVVAAFAAGSADAQRPRSILHEYEDAFVELSEAVSPSVVEISAIGKSPPGDRSNMQRFFDRFRQDGGEEGAPEQDPTPQRFRAPDATGSGFIFDTLGHIITNNHVVEGSQALRVQLSDGSEHDAEIVGQDPGADIAVIKIDPTGLDLLPVVTGDSDALRVGQFAIAIGSARGQTGSISYGHISGLGRDGLRLPDPELRFQQFIQTDAAINLGNSGGPLLNIDGEVIGVNVAIVWGANSIGFAIPINRVKQIVPQLIATGSVVRGWLGVSIQDLSVVAQAEQLELDEFLDAYSLPDGDGTFIRGVTDDGPADEAGLQEEDVIRRIDDNVIASSQHLINVVSDITPGTEANIEVWRHGKSKVILVTVGKFPGLQAARFGRDFLGIYVRDLDLSEEALKRLELKKNPSEFYVVEVKEDSPAARGGIQPGDVLLEIAHKDVTTLENLKKVLSEDARPGKTLLLRVMRIRREEYVIEKMYIKVPEDFVLD